MKPLLLILLLFYAGQSPAQLFKCVDQNGVITYTDAPCAGDTVKSKAIPTPDAPLKNKVLDTIDGLTMAKNRFILIYSALVAGFVFYLVRKILIFRHRPKPDYLNEKSPSVLETLGFLIGKQHRYAQYRAYPGRRWLPSWSFGLCVVIGALAVLIFYIPEVLQDPIQAIRRAFSQMLYGRFDRNPP